uniref:PX domain-containing protein n=1 Tax=Angiostrongylus cantonensis TaxID=6313 RepID=A0A0K0DN06_ANGCA
MPMYELKFRINVVAIGKIPFINTVKFSILEMLQLHESLLAVFEKPVLSPRTFYVSVVLSRYFWFLTRDTLIGTVIVLFVAGLLSQGLCASYSDILRRSWKQVNKERYSVTHVCLFLRKVCSYFQAMRADILPRSGLIRYDKEINSMEVIDSRLESFEKERLMWEVRPFSSCGFSFSLEVLMFVE